MPQKRPSILAKLKNEQPATPEPVAPSAPRPAPAANQPETLKSSLYLPAAVHRRLKEIAFTEDRKMHELFLEGVDRVIESRGHAERARPKKAE